MRKKVWVGIALLLFLGILSCLTGTSAGAPSEILPTVGEKYPDRNVYGTIVYAPGGACDTFARALIPLVQKDFGQTIILNNVTGGSGAIGMHQAYSQADDGYTLLFAAEGQQLFPLLGISDLSYNNFIPVGIYASCNAVVFVGKDSSYQTLEELVDAILANPGKIKMGNSGAGGVAYVFSAILNKLTGAKLNEIPFNGENPCKAAVLGGQVDFTVTTYIASKTVLDAGLVKPLAVVSDKRQVGLEDVPALGEIYPEYLNYVSLRPFYGAYVKEGTPDEVVKKLEESFKAGMESQEFADFVADMGAVQLQLFGKEAREFLDTYQQLGGWILYDADSISISPDSLGLKRPGE